MPKMLIDGALEYEDGTPATESQVRSCAFIEPYFANFIVKAWID